ncbi:hypothetical protein BF49_4224 [Bradyrhizobium sp.]|nr:hypothetical protein BF49_4224 [Bradyrhizobium sp.]
MGSFHVISGRPAHSARRAQKGVERDTCVFGVSDGLMGWGKPDARKGLRTRGSQRSPDSQETSTSYGTLRRRFQGTPHTIGDRGAEIVMLEI